MTLQQGQPFRVHQYHPIVTFGDAISNQMFFIQRALKNAGVGGSIFTHRAKGLAPGAVFELPSDEVWNGDLLILHHSSGNPKLEEVLEYELPRALIYHNITPESFYSHDPHIQGLCRLGREQLAPLAKRCHALFSVSQFNGRELPSSVRGCLPLFPLKTGPQLAGWNPGDPMRLLFVGRIAPHKNQELLIRTVAELTRNTDRDYRLHLVGGGDPLYMEFLRLTAKHLGVADRVQFSGKIPDEAKEGFFRNSHLFVSASLHEGFGVPLVEAMQQGLPVVALDRGAVGETLGDSGVRIDSEDPRLLAGAIETLAQHPELAREVLLRQRARLEELKDFCREETISEAILPILRELRTTPRSVDTSPEVHP